MTFREDESRIRKGKGPLAFNVMRKMAGLDDKYRSILLENGIKMR